MSWKMEVQANSTDTWRDNALRFEDKSEAIAYARDLMMRWMAVREVRTVYTNEPATHAWRGGKAVAL